MSLSDIAAPAPLVIAQRTLEQKRPEGRAG